ncbi:MAG: TetR/AcrR family transcriptional regulator [Clostridium argentinense]|uniref:TetR/AcrR family transcriptional regulator n=1 Tax=Clostridium faecium TaxID=2762223 RepID=A0ABR8YRJ9_9CLOT|nr:MULTISPECIES: TetR/AcrR family transcriptional regulator [Clostridium]MBD8046509.1 TetR/AcrR family transcriptional regulator [Clostridium faecium]MBS5823018.1 TetR/AcrR family transcriptional regulator [Clostridium argentinense]MDU1349176.1 TetR/AcrR family transcriptional regulator [Clostridium argentinense]
MGTTERRQLEREIIKKKILEAANAILVKEGYENLSIRKIAKRIEYSPGIIYHYFKDKDEIVTLIVEEGYERILKTISKIPVDIENPDKSIVESLKAYVELMLEAPEQFRAIVMNNVEGIQDKLNVLGEGISKKRKSIEYMCNLVSLGIEKGIFREMDIELTAQIIWTSTYGLISRLILEKNIPKKQKDRLIDHHFQILINGLLK